VVFIVFRIIPCGYEMVKILTSKTKLYQKPGKQILMEYIMFLKFSIKVPVAFFKNPFW